MWRFTLQVIKLSLTEKPSLTVPYLLAITLLSLPFPVPVLGQLAFIMNLFLVFSFLVFTSKLVAFHGEDLASLRLELKKASFLRVLTAYPGETAGVILGHLILTVLAGLVAALVILVGGSSFLIVPLIRGEGVSWWGVLVFLLLALFIYFSVVTSFPLFFGRAVLKGRGFWETLYKFLSSVFAETSWRTLLNCDYTRSSLVISFLILLVITANLLFLIVPPLFVLSPVLSFLGIHVAYTFGTVACLKILRS